MQAHMQDTNTLGPDLDAALAVDQRRRDAMIAADLTTLGEVLDADLIYIHSSGAVDDLRGYLDTIETGSAQYLAIETSYSLSHRISPDSILISGRSKLQTIQRGQPVDLDNLFITVWVRRGEAWKLLSWQSTPLRKS